MNKQYPRISRSILSIVSAALLLGLVVPVSLAAQPETFSFGPPLRKQILFAYKYTERLRETEQMLGEKVDSSNRILSYYITQRMLPGDGGTTIVEANIDSMRVEYNGAGGRLLFNTQALQGSEGLVKHREVLAASSLVNRMVTFTLSPYGQIVQIESPAIKDLLEQSDSPTVDAFTRERIHALAGDGYLASIYFPWRGVVPLGQKVAYGENLSIPFWTSINQLSFRDTATVTVNKSTDATPGPTVRYSAVLSHPINTKIALTPIAEPMTLANAGGTLNGELRLDEDGSVLSGWSIASGMASSTFDGQTVTTTYNQEVYIDLLALAPF